MKIGEPDGYLLGHNWESGSWIWLSLELEEDAMGLRVYAWTVDIDEHSSSVVRM